MLDQITNGCLRNLWKLFIPPVFRTYFRNVELKSIPAFWPEQRWVYHQRRICQGKLHFVAGTYPSIISIYVLVQLHCQFFLFLTFMFKCRDKPTTVPITLKQSQASKNLTREQIELVFQVEIYASKYIKHSPQNILISNVQNIY